jgi:hypothetical protein
MIPIYLAIFAGILAVIGSITQYNEKESAKKKAEENRLKAEKFNDELKEAQTKIITAQKIIIDEQRNTRIATDKLVEAYEKLEKAQETIQNLQTETIKNLVGDGFVTTDYINIGNSTVKPSLINKNSYPLYEVEMTVVDFKKMLNCKRLPSDDDTITIPKSCLDSCSYSSYPKFTLVSNVYKDVNFQIKITQEPQYFLSLVKTLNITTFQYSVLYKDYSGKLIRKFKIYERKRIDGTFKFINEDVKASPKTVAIINRV